MLKSLPWIILGGIALIAAVVLFEVLGAVWYLRSPERVVKGAFEHLLNAKSFSLTAEGSDDAPNGMSFKVDGTLDKQQLAKPSADLTFSFQSAGQSFYGNGEAKAKDGELYLRFDQIAGIPGVLPGALRSIWADLNMNALLVVGKDQFFPQATGDLTEADLDAIKDIAIKHIPFIPLGAGDSGWLGLVAVEHYRIGLDRDELKALVGEVKTAVKGSPLSDAEKSDISKTVSALPPVSGEVWVARDDGTLRAAVFTVKNKDSSLHLNLRFSDYDKQVAVEAPLSSQPLIELVRRLTGPTLTNAALKLPFTIPVPIYNVNEPIPVVPNAAPGGTGKNLGPLPDLIRLFYGTDTLFAK